MGENGQLWGGECLLVDYQHSQYLGGLPAVALPGGDLAAKQPWRNWLAHLHQFVPQWQEILTKTCTEPNWQILINAIERGLNCPPISSAGRLFDAVAYDLGIAPTLFLGKVKRLAISKHWQIVHPLPYNQKCGQYSCKNAAYRQ